MHLFEIQQKDDITTIACCFPWGNNNSKRTKTKNQKSKIKRGCFLLPQPPHFGQYQHHSCELFCYFCSCSEILSMAWKRGTATGPAFSLSLFFFGFVFQRNFVLLFYMCRNYKCFPTCYRKEMEFMEICFFSTSFFLQISINQAATNLIHKNNYRF